MGGPLGPDLIELAVGAPLAASISSSVADSVRSALIRSAWRTSGVRSGARDDAWCSTPVAAMMVRRSSAANTAKLGEPGQRSRSCPCEHPDYRLWCVGARRQPLGEEGAILIGDLGRRWAAAPRSAAPHRACAPPLEEELRRRPQQSRIAHELVDEAKPPNPTGGKLSTMATQWSRGNARHTAHFQVNSLADH